MADHLLLIDASSSIYRAFFALPTLSSSKGVPTNATLGFVSMLQKVMREQRPDYLVVVWDSREPRRRKQLYPEYKATRDAMPEELVRQLPYIRRAVAAYGLASAEYEGEEADDVIATLVRRAQPLAVRISIVSTDRDLMQLVSPNVVLLDTMRERCYGPDQVQQRFGVPPERMLDYRSLVGDSSDNIPGVRGIGEKGAAQLIRTYGTLDNLLAHTEEISAKRARQALQDGAESARLSRELSRLRDDLPLEFDLPSAVIPAADVRALAELFDELELERLRRGLGQPAPQPTSEERHSPEIGLLQTREELVQRLRPLADSSRLALACVIEPDDAMTGELIGIALAADPDHAYYVPLSDLGDGALEKVRPLLEHPQRVWIGHDLKRDYVALARRGVRLGGELRDIAVAAYVLEPSPQVRRPGLLARGYLGRALPLSESLFGKGAKRRPAHTIPCAELADYFGTQVAAALELDHVVESKLAECGELDLYREIEVPLVGVLGRMELCGVRIDETRLAQLSGEIERELAVLRARIFELAGEEFKINSPKQLQHILFEKLQLPAIKRTKTGFSTDESVLEELSHDHELPRQILDFRHLTKLANTYVDALPRLVHPQTGRIHCSFNQTVAATGRLSASNPNLQNIPIRTPLGQRIREAFVPAEGKLMLAADYSQIELRLLAHVSGDAPLLDAFRQGIDIHVRTASLVFGIPPEQVTSEQRAQMKGINFGIIYGSSAFGIARQLGIAQSEAQAHIQAYFERYPGVRTFLDQAIRQAREKGYAETLDGRRRYLPDLRSRNRSQRAAAERMATNSVLQGTAADIIKRAMVRIDRALAAPGAPAACMILTVHDELVFEVSPDDREELMALVESQMRGVAQLAVPLEVNVCWGRNWREAH